MIHLSHWSSIVAALGLVAGLSACSDDGDTQNPDTNRSGTTRDPSTEDKDPLVILSERQTPDGAMHYLHVLPDWPADGKLDYSKAVELGKPGVATVFGDALYFYHAEAGRIERLTIDDELRVNKLGQRENVISFVEKGIKGFSAEPVFSSPQAAYLIDEESGQIARFNPSAMAIDEVQPLSPTVLRRSDLKLSLQHGVAAGGRLFSTASWRDYDTGRVIAAAAIGVFDEKNLTNGPSVVEDPRCASSTSAAVFADGDYVYAVGDAANAWDVLYSPMRTSKPQCVVRMRKDASSFDQSYFVDLQAVTGSPAIRLTWPMAGGKLLANLWASEIDPATVIKPGDPDSFWKAKGWTYAVVDLATKTAKRIAAIPPGPAESAKFLHVDGENYLQVFRADRSSVLHRVNADATITQVLDQPNGANIQYLARLPIAR